MTTLKNLYNGNINPCELKRLTERKDYKTATAHVSDARDEFETTLSEVQQYLFEKYSKELDMLSLIVEEEIFREGFALAMSIKEEVSDMKDALLCKSFERMPEMLTVAEAAELLRFSTNHLYYIIEKDKSFPVLMLGRKKIIPRDELRKWIKKNSYRNTK